MRLCSLLHLHRHFQLGLVVPWNLLALRLLSLLQLDLLALRL